MFPLVDHRGRVVGFGGRTLKDENPKYLNSPEGPLYQKGQLLYGLYQARRAIADADEVVVVEGYTDVIWDWRRRGSRTWSPPWAPRSPTRQIGLMMRFTSNVTFMFDADRAGTEAMLRSGELARGPLAAPSGGGAAGRATIRPMSRCKGAQEQVSRVLAGKMSLLGFELRQALDRSDTATADGRVRAFEEVRRIMERAVSLKEREEEIPMVADRLRLSPDSVALLLRGPSDRRRPPPPRRPGGDARARRWPSGCWATRPSSSGSSWWRRPATPAGRPASFRLSRRSISPTPATGRCSRVSARPSPHWPSSDDGQDGPCRAARRGPTATRKPAGSSCGWSWKPIRSDTPVAVLEELHLRLQEQYLKRTITALRSASG